MERLVKEFIVNFDDSDNDEVINLLKMLEKDITMKKDYANNVGDIVWAYYDYTDLPLNEVAERMSPVKAKKFFFELAVKNDDSTIQQMLISKWKALEAIAKIKGGFLQIIIPNGSFKFATSLVKANHIEAKLIKIGDL